MLPRAGTFHSKIHTAKFTCNKRKIGEGDNALSARITGGCPVSAVYERFTGKNNLAVPKCKLRCPSTEKVSFSCLSTMESFLLENNLKMVGENKDGIPHHMRELQDNFNNLVFPATENRG